MKWERIKKLCYGLNSQYVDYIEISKKVIQGLYDGVTTVELDNLAAETAATMAANHPDNAILAARIAISNLHKETDKSFSKTIKALYNYVDPKTGEKAGLIGENAYKFIWKNRDQLDSVQNKACFILLFVALVSIVLNYTIPYFGFVLGDFFQEAWNKNELVGKTFLSQAILWSGIAINELFIAREMLARRFALYFLGFSILFFPLAFLYALFLSLSLFEIALLQYALIFIYFAFQCFLMIRGGVLVFKFWALSLILTFFTMQILYFL